MKLMSQIKGRIYLKGYSHLISPIKYVGVSFIVTVFIGNSLCELFPEIQGKEYIPSETKEVIGGNNFVQENTPYIFYIKYNG